MAKRHTQSRPSSIDRLPPELRELIGKLRFEGKTIDEILSKLRELEADVSRSALGRHVKGLAEIGERMRRSREMATALVERFGAQPENKLAQLNLELMHSVVFDTITAAAEPEDGEEPQSVTFDPMQVMFLAKALKELSGAAKTDADRMIKVRDDAALQATKAAAKAVDEAAKDVPGGLTKETVDAIKARILGVRKP